MERTLRLGEWTVVGRGWLQKRRIMFAGESSPSVYSLVLEWTKSHNSAAYNLYFNKSQKDFQVFKGHLIIQNVNMNEMRFRFEK